MKTSTVSTQASAATTIAIAQPASASAPMHIVYEGWVLKKRRKKMQGFARRYFTLHQSGLLSYSFGPGQPSRDSVFLHHAAISTAPGRKDIHIDSSTATFHIKCLRTDDFNSWMAAFRRFIGPGPDARKSFSVRHTARQGSLSLNKSTVIVEEMGSIIAELDEAIHAMKSDQPHKKHHIVNRTKSEREKLKEQAKDVKPVFGLFKRSHHEPLPTLVHNASDPSQLTPQERAENALDALNAQYALLLKAIYCSIPLDHGQSTHSSLVLPSTQEETEEPPIASPTVTRASKRVSVATTLSDSINEWFDALEGEGAQEFVLDAQATADGNEQLSKVLTNDSRSSLGHGPESDNDTDIEEEGMTSSRRLPSEDPSRLHSARRTKLPSPVIADEGSLFAVLKKNVGKDLSAIALPVTFNEPLTLLQRAAEEVEYYDLLTQAATARDPVERMCYIAAFAVSSYAHTRHRTGRKGFNPMLSETFEDARMKFIAEKVRHQPLVMAYHAEGSGWELYATSSGKTKFWGKSLEIIPLGTTHVKIGDDHFEWKKPSSFLRNMMVGTKYLEHCGKLSIENTTTQARCVLEFKQSGYWGAANVVSGSVYSPLGEVVSELDGKWDEQLAQTLDSEHFRMLWRVTPYPKNIHEYYGFTSFGITLNEITSGTEAKFPPTDSRYRPDVRALEEGDLDYAEEQKQRVEEMQRERRRKGKDRQPRWFKQVGEEWEYVGGYWEARSRGWKGVSIESLW